MGRDGRSGLSRLNAGLRRGFLMTVGILAITIGVFALLEGLAGSVLATWDVARNAGRGGLQSRQHAVHDTLLGWINRPGFNNPDMYGVGLDLVINGQSIRDHEPTPVSEPDVVRIVCSGDSFTLGIGVSNEDTWCAMLERADPRIRSINMGHAGYGIDQSYLHYRRDRQHFEHDVHVFAFIPDDIRRLRLGRFSGYDKPYFSLDSGRLELRNVPVPEPSTSRAFMMRVQEYLRPLHILRIAERVGTRLDGVRQLERVNTESEALDIAVALMDSLAVSARSHDRIAVFVLLGQRLGGSRDVDEQATALARETSLRGLTLVDLRKKHRALPADSLEAMFNPSASGHYSVSGNARVALDLWRELSAMPEVQRRLNAVDCAEKPGGC